MENEELMKKNDELRKEYKAGWNDAIDAVCDYLDSHNLKSKDGHYLLKIASDEVLITTFYLQEVKQQLKK